MPNEKEDVWAPAYNELQKIMNKLERHHKYPQDVEFTVQDGKLDMLQTRNAKRTGLAEYDGRLKWQPEKIFILE